MGNAASNPAETVLIKVPEKALPDRLLGAFTVFEDALAAEREDDPDWIDRSYQADGMIGRYEMRCFYYPRSTIVEVFEDAIKGGGGGTGGSSWTIGHSAEIRYRDAGGKEKTTGVFSEVSRWQPTPNGATFLRIKKWFDATADRA